MEHTIEKTKDRAAIWSSIATAGYISGENKNTNLKRYVHPNIYCSIIYSSQDMKDTSYTSINSLMCVVCI